MSQAQEAGGHTLGVAIDIPPPAGDLLDEARSRYEPEAGELRPHVTLLPPIDVDAEAMPAVLRHLEQVARDTAPFRLTLSGTGTFVPVTRVVFVTVTDGAEDCARLEARVRSGDMAVETRYPYHPHVTLAHDVPDALLDRALADLAGFTAEVDVTAIRLFERRSGRWEIIREFVLTGTR